MASVGLLLIYPSTTAYDSALCKNKFMFIIVLDDNPSSLDSVSGKNNRTIDEFIDCYKNKLLEPNSIYDEFIRVYKSECSKIYSGDELKSKLNLKKAKNIRKSTINNALTILEKPYKVIKSNCKWKIVEKK